MADQTIPSATSLLDSVISTLTTKVMADKAWNISKPDLSEKFLPDVIKSIIYNAKHDDHIIIENMCRILSISEVYNEILERLFSRYNIGSTGTEFKVSTRDERYELWTILSEIWFYKEFGTWPYPFGETDKAVKEFVETDHIKPYRFDDGDYQLKPDIKGKLTKLDDIRIRFEAIGIRLPTELFPYESARNQPTIPYNGLHVERAKHCLKEWKDANGFIWIETFIDGMVLFGYDEDDIHRIYQLCGYRDWVDVRKKNGWDQIAWHGIIYRLAFNIFINKGGKAKQGDYEPLGTFCLWDKDITDEQKKSTRVCIKLGNDLDEYFDRQFGIRIPTYNRMLNLWPLEPIQSLNKTEDAFWEKSWEIGFPEGCVDDYKKGGDDWQEKALLVNKKGGAVRLFELSYILSKDEEWSKLLCGLWEICGFNSNQARRDFPQWNDCFLMDAETIERAWFWVLARLTIEEEGTFVTIDRTDKSEIQIKLESYYFGRLTKQYPVGDYRVFLYRSIPIDETGPMSGFNMQHPDFFICLEQFQEQIFGVYQLCKTKFRDVDFPKKLIRIPGQENTASFPISEPMACPEPENLGVTTVINKTGLEQARDEDFVISRDANIGWENITATFISDQEILFQFSGQSVSRRYDVLGFEDKRNKNPIRSWKVLFMASEKGYIPWNFETRRNVEKIAQTIRGKFRRLFPAIVGDPLSTNNQNSRYGFLFIIRKTNGPAEFSSISEYDE